MSGFENEALPSGGRLLSFLVFICSVWSLHLYDSGLGKKTLWLTLRMAVVVIILFQFDVNSVLLPLFPWLPYLLQVFDCRPLFRCFSLLLGLSVEGTRMQLLSAAFSVVFAR